MVLIVFVGLAALAVPLARGRLLNLAQLRFRRNWLLVAALSLQATLIFVHGPKTGMREATYIVSYLLSIAFLFENRRIPGLWLIGMGALLNLTAIAANGGVMPASSHALAAAGLPTDTHLSQFTNSMAVPNPKLSFLGDIFAIPRSWPLSNVFSAGDICVALGAMVAIHRVSGSRLLPSGRGQFRPLFHQPTFMRLWSAQAISNLGDWTYALAVAYTLVHKSHDPQALALLLMAQVAPAAIFGAAFSALPDRHSRIKLMIGADVLRAVAVGSLFIGTPSLMHIYAVAAMLGMCGALFQPCLQASIPNVVEEKHIVAANALVGATYNFAIMAGPAIGGLLVYKLGVTPVFVINAISFILSAGLIAGIKLPMPTGNPQERTAVRDLVEGAKYSLRTPLVRGLLIVIGIVLVAAASKAPLESWFILRTLSLGPEALGLVLGSWGLGMLLGSVAAPAVCRRWPRETVLALTIVVVGIAVLVASQARDLQTVLLAWLAAGAANSVANVSYESLLQERTPDSFRGRVFAAFEFVTNVGFLLGAFLAGWMGAHLGIRASYVFSGTLFLAAAVLCRKLLPAHKVGTAVLVGFDRLRRGRDEAEIPESDDDLEHAEYLAPSPERIDRELLVPVPAASEPVAVPPSPQPEPEPQPVHDTEPVFALVGAPPETEAASFEDDDAGLWYPEPAIPHFDGPDDWTDDPAPVPDHQPAAVVPDDPLALLSSFDPDDRLRGISLAASASDPLVAAIIGALVDPAAQVRRRAALELGELRMAESLPALDHALDDVDESVRAAAIEALGRFDDDAVLVSLVTALKDPVQEIRDAAAAELLRRDSETVVRILGEALATRSVRNAAIEVLSRMGGAAVEPLVDMLANANGLRPALGAALAEVAGPERFVEDLSILDPSRRLRAVEALGAMGGPLAPVSLARALSDPEPDVRRRAAELLSEVASADTREDLERAAYDPVPEVAEAARRSLAHLDAELQGAPS